MILSFSFNSLFMFGVAVKQKGPLEEKKEKKEEE